MGFKSQSTNLRQHLTPAIARSREHANDRLKRSEPFSEAACTSAYWTYYLPFSCSTTRSVSQKSARGSHCNHGWMQTRTVA